MSIEVSSKGLIKLRILKSNNSDVSSMKNYKNVIEFNVSDGYVVDTYSCTSGDYVYDNIEDTLTISNASDNTICNVSYKTGYKKLKDIILGRGLSLDNGLLVTNNTNSGKPSYYYKGIVDNNYILIPEKSGDTTVDVVYRIVRINEDGSVRLIREKNTLNDTINCFSVDSVPFTKMYYSNTNEESSNFCPKGMMKTINDWYKKTLENTIIDTYIVESTFCEEAKISWNENALSSGNITLKKITTDYIPDLRCNKDANGYGPLSLKVGLITLDEVILSGLGVNSDTKRSNVYIDNGDYWWIMTPGGRNLDSIGGGFSVWFAYTGGYASGYGLLGGSNGRVRPVFSINTDNLDIIGKGLKTNPFKIIFK